MIERDFEEEAFLVCGEDERRVFLKPSVRRTFRDGRRNAPPRRRRVRRAARRVRGGALPLAERDRPWRGTTRAWSRVSARLRRGSSACVSLRKRWTECVAVGGARRTDAQDAAAASAAARARRDGTRRRPRRWPGWPGAIPPRRGARYDARRGGDNGGGDAAVPEAHLLTFNPLSADDWPKRREALDRFAQAGRRVIVRNRAEKRLRGARRLLRASASARESGTESLLTEKGAAAYVARDVTETMARSTDDTKTKVLEQTLDPARRAFARARAEEVREARLGVARLDALASLFTEPIPNSTDAANVFETFQTTTKRRPERRRATQASVAFVPRRARVGVHAPPHHR